MRVKVVKRHIHDANLSVICFVNEINVINSPNLQPPFRSSSSLGSSLVLQFANCYTHDSISV